MTTDSAEIMQFDCIVGATNELFSFTPIGAGPYYQIKIPYSGKCVNVSSGKLDNNLKIIQFGCVSTAGIGFGNEQWRLEYVGGTGLDIIVRPRAASSDSCIDITGAGTANGVNAVQFTCNGGSNQHYYLRMQG